ncbi:hypothetical protein [Aliivibrio sp. SR45-2]|uniref:hypothetical protein n=1 Tax=Aliivibrio sp. SR45-2 TaxID=2760931 RepID=UPI0015F7DA99|nr:hypothetical protein [Aliivibrio sp. SR45-2]MBB1314097.1 hypothetical protein [Aliivibrio sp. SR45-2]
MMTSIFRQEYNGCKSYGCANCGESDLSRYHRSNRLGYEAYHCPLCGAYPPVLLNFPILELADQITKDKTKTQSILFCRCDYQPSFNWRKYGKTKIGTQKVQCKQCGSVDSLINSDKVSRRLQPLWRGIINGISPHLLRQEIQSNPKTFYQQIDELVDVLHQVSQLLEIMWLKKNTSIILQTNSHHLECRSGFLRKKVPQKHTRLWCLNSIIASNGYHLLFNDNLLINNDTGEIEKREECRYKIEKKELSVVKNDNVLLTAEMTYSTILARSQFDQLGYCDAIYAQSSEGTLVRPVYSAHAHMQTLRQIIPFTTSITCVLEHESFIRGAAITTLSSEVKKGQSNLYYSHIYEWPDPIQLPEKIHDVVLGKPLSWWGETWHCFNHQYNDKTWSIAVGSLTKKKEDKVDGLIALFPTHPDWNQLFWDGFHSWISNESTRKISHRYLMQWVKVYRFLYNFIEVGNRLNTNLSLNMESIEELVTFLNNSAIESRNEKSQ